MHIKSIAKAALLCAMWAAMTGCDEESIVPFSLYPATGSATYPTAPDSFDQAGDTNRNAAGATPISVGQSYALSVFPQGDLDYVKVQLTAGTEYEFSANKVCATCDVYLYLYDTDGTTLISSSDDYVYLDSRLTYTPGATGTYYLRVEAYDEDYGVGSYRLNVHELVDGDTDGYSSYYDCNDANSAILPDAADVAGDGIDQDCSGTDAPAALIADSFEADNDVASAKAMPESLYGQEESLYIFQVLSGQDRTIHDGADVDWLRVVVPAHGAYDLGHFTMAGPSPSMAVFESDGVTPHGSSDVENDTASAKTFYVRFSGTAGGVYVPFFENIGVDVDGDGFYSRDWDEERDCNDDDPDINPDATEVVDNGVDENCDASDDSPA